MDRSDEQETAQASESLVEAVQTIGRRIRPDLSEVDLRVKAVEIADEVVRESPEGKLEGR